MRRPTGWTAGCPSRSIPRLAHDTAATVAEARALWWLVDRPNLFIKIPAAQQGLPAIEACLAEGISINVTLIFSLDRYDAVMEAFLAGLERARAGRATTCPPSRRSRRSSCPGWTPRSTRGWTRSARREAARAARPGGHRQRAARLRALRAGVQPGPVGRAARGRCPAAAPAVGVHIGQGPGLPGHPVRDWPGRARRGQHHAGSHAARGRRPRRNTGRLRARLLRPGAQAVLSRPRSRSGIDYAESSRPWRTTGVTAVRRQLAAARASSSPPPCGGCHPAARRTDMSGESTFVIAGASLAGAKAAEALRERGLRRSGHPDRRRGGVRPYERPPLSKDYLQGKAEPRDDLRALRRLVWRARRRRCGWARRSPGSTGLGTR